MTEPTELADRYAALEQRLEPQKQRSIARGPLGLLAVLVVLTLAVATVVAVDLRRLQTPRGTALAWTGAAVFGDCAMYERLTFDPLDEAACERLREATQEARETAGRIGIDLVSVEQRGREATVEVEIRRGDDARVVALPLRRKGDGWAVELTDEVCDAVGCAGD